MSDLQNELDGIRDRAEKARDNISGRQAWGVSAADVPRLLAAVEAVLKLARDADRQDRLISPDILRKRITNRLTGEDDE